MQITELSKEIFRLKEALGALSPPLGITSSSSTHHGNPGQQVALQNRIAILSQQLQVRRALTPGMYEMRANMMFSRLWVTATFSVAFLQDWERKHKQVVTIYRSHLLAAVQVSLLCTAETLS